MPGNRCRPIRTSHKQRKRLHDSLAVTIQLRARSATKHMNDVHSSTSSPSSSSSSMSLYFAKRNQPEQVLSFGYCSTHCSRFVNWKCTDVRRGLCSFCCSRLTQNDSECEMKIKQNENGMKTDVAHRVLFQ